MSELLIEEKRRIFTIPLSAEELEQISDCRKGICAAIAVGSTFGLFGGRMALGPKPANLLIKSLVIGCKSVGKSVFLIEFSLRGCGSTSWFWCRSSTIFYLFEIQANKFVARIAELQVMLIYEIVSFL